FELYDPARHCTAIFDGSGDETADFLAYAPDYCKITSNTSWLDSSVSSPDPGEPFSLEMDANNTGAVRTGTVTVSYGSVSKTITVKQAPALGAISLTSPSLATSKTSPTVISYGDLTLRWPRIANAAQYTISTMYYDDGVIKLADTGASSYSCVIPKEWFDPYRTSYQCIYLDVDDSYGYQKSQTFYVKVAAGELVQLNGQTAPVWTNAPDVAVQETYAVEATGNWTASADQAWITLSAPSGASGDSLTVSLAENLSANARTGRVTVKSGSASAVLAISQCAYLAQEKPTLLSPLYSEDKGAPTAISPTDSLTFHWLYEPQTITCHLTLHRFKDESRTETLAESPRFNTAVDSYTFTDLELQAGELYYVKLHRYTDRWNRTSRTFYFTLSDVNAWVKLDDASAAEMETDGDGGSEVFDVTASGYWMARANDDWLMVHKASLDEEDLAEDEKTAADYALYGNVSGTALYVSALPNPGSAPRTGTVTVTCGSASAVITVTQYQNYTTAALTSHTLGGKPSASVDVPFGAMNLRWNKADGGTGRYEIILYESENRISYYKVLSSDGITAQSYSIPSGKFTEGMYYRLWLGTEVADDDYAGQNYY
ncbi:MAG: BACON domain-containing protein, partial [Clostridia bacterium]|nr:BACON domain-containing protein [Clostridia bacterium]